jgi:flagellar protein FliO/FliZ
MVQIIFSLLLVLAAIVMVAWLLKRLNASKLGGGNQLKVLGGVAIGQRERIVLVEVSDTWLVVGVGPGQIRTLHTLQKQELPYAATVPESAGNSGFANNPDFTSNKFAKLLSTLLHR